MTALQLLHLSNPRVFSDHSSPYTPIVAAGTDTLSSAQPLAFKPASMGFGSSRFHCPCSSRPTRKDGGLSCEGATSSSLRNFGNYHPSKPLKPIGAASADAPPLEAGAGGPPGIVGTGGGEGGNGGSGSGGGGTEGEGHGKKKLKMSQIVTLAYALLVIGGGTMGFLKSGSIKSLLSGLGSGLTLLYVFARLPVDAAGASSVGLGVSGALLIVMGMRFMKSKKFMPAGLVAVMSFIMSGGYIHGIMRSHH